MQRARDLSGDTGHRAAEGDATAAPDRDRATPPRGLPGERLSAHADTSYATSYPEHPPRVRLEWLLAGGRVLFVAGALLAAALETQKPPHYALIANSLALYLAYSLAIVALVWRPLAFGRGWAVAQHTFDLVAFSWLTLITEGTESPLHISYVFLAICGTLRWQMKGALWTGAFSIAALALVGMLGRPLLGAPPFALDTFVRRATHLAVMAALLGYLGAYHQRYQREINRLVAWPRRIPEDWQALVNEVVSQCALVLETRRVLLVWEEPGEGHVNVASMAHGAIDVSREPEGSFGALVVHRLERASFQALDAGEPHGRVLYGAASRLRACYCRPINEALRTRFAMRAVQSWPLEGEVVHGRLFSLDKGRMDVDDLVIGELVARLAVSRLDSLYLLREIRQAAALAERIRVASDLHDSLLQSLAGTALQLVAARRLLDRDPVRAAERLGEIQQQIEQGELEMRAFIRRLRPGPPVTTEAARLIDRLRDFGRRIERQWSIRVKMDLDDVREMWPATFEDEIFRIVREGILNAARHADASLVAVRLGITPEGLRLQITDDGRGFPFRGRYRLEDLVRSDWGPWSLKERVIALGGDLEIISSDNGSQIVVILPLVETAGGRGD